MTKPIEQEDGTFLNETEQLVNAEGVLLDDDGAMINEEGFLINATGQLLNEEGLAVNDEGALIDEEGNVIKAKGEEGEDGEADNKMIPKSRYDSASRRAKLAEEELKTTRAELSKAAKTSTTDGGVPTSIEDFEAKIDEVDGKIEAARKDGDVEAVITLNKEMRLYERGMYQKIAKDEATGAGTKAQQKIAVDSLISKLETDYDAFNPDSESFDQAVVDEVLDLQGAFIAKGDSPAQAMAKAVGYVMGEPDDAGKPGARKTDVQKNLDAAGKQAPNIGGTGKSSAAGGDKGNAKNVEDMTTEEFDALPNETKKRLRGDAYANV